MEIKLLKSRTIDELNCHHLFDNQRALFNLEKATVFIDLLCDENLVFVLCYKYLISGFFVVMTSGF